MALASSFVSDLWPHELRFGEHRDGGTPFHRSVVNPERDTLMSGLGMSKRIYLEVQIQP
jgi:hypothetical protein